MLLVTVVHLFNSKTMITHKTHQLMVLFIEDICFPNLIIVLSPVNKNLSPQSQ